MRSATLARRIFVFCYTEFAAEISMVSGTFAYLRIEIPIAQTRGARDVSGDGHAQPVVHLARAVLG